MADHYSEWVQARSQWAEAHDRLVDWELGQLQAVNDGRLVDFSEVLNEQALRQMESLAAAELEARRKRDEAWRHVLESPRSSRPSADETT